MRWSLSLGRILGIQFRIHVTFLLLLLFIFLSLASQKGTEAAVRGTLFVCAVFACVLIHEIGHSLIAQRFGKGAKSITLLPIGGIATLEEVPEKPTQEMAISIIGPFINLAIAGVLYLFVDGWTGLRAPSLDPDSAQAFLGGLISVNVLLALFNLIPAFPMDGGRILRAALALGMDYVRATSIAVTIGQAVSMLFIFFGIFFNWWLALIGVFLYMGAGGEQHHVMLRAVLRRVPTSEVTITDFRSLRPDEPLSRALHHVYHGCQEDFPVMGEHGVEGILTRQDLLAAIHDKGVNIPVSEVMDRQFVSIEAETPLDKVYQKILTRQKTTAAVFRQGVFQGIVGLDAISRYFMIQSALQAGTMGQPRTAV